MNNISIDLDDELVKYIKEKCGRDITHDIEIIINTALEEKNIKEQNVSISISAVGKNEIHQINKDFFETKPNLQKKNAFYRRIMMSKN